MSNQKFLKAISNILFYFTLEQRFARRLPHLNRDWIYMVFRYCEISPLPFDEIFDDVQEAIQKKDFAIIFRGAEGWDMLLIIEHQWYSEKLAKKFFVEDHCFEILENVFRHSQREMVISKLRKIGGNQ